MTHTAEPELLGRAYDLISAAVADLSAGEMLLATRCRGWTVQDLLLHQLLDAQRALVAFATPADREPDVDAVSYWRPFRPDRGDGGVGHARFVRIAASAYADPQSLVAHWDTTSAAAVRAAAAADPDGWVETQGHVLTVPDFLGTLVLEATVHHLDLVVGLPPDRPGTSPLQEAIALTRGVLEELYGAPLPAAWDDDECVLKGTGRVELAGEDRRLLGGGTGGLPLLG